MPRRNSPTAVRKNIARQISAAGFRLKGGGWYETDFKSGDEKKRNLADSGDKPKQEAAGKDDAKPAGKDVEKATTADSGTPKPKKPEAKETKATPKSARKGAGSEAA